MTCFARAASVFVSNKTQVRVLPEQFPSSGSSFSGERPLQRRWIGWRGIAIYKILFEGCCLGSAPLYYRQIKRIGEVRQQTAQYAANSKSICSHAQNTNGALPGSPVEYLPTNLCGTSGTGSHSVLVKESILCQYGMATRCPRPPAPSIGQMGLPLRWQLPLPDEQAGSWQAMHKLSAP